LALAGCGGTRLVLPLTFVPGELPAPTDPRLLSTHAAAVSGIAAILSEELDLPVPADFTVFVYGSRGVFERGLVEDARVARARAAELSDFAIGVGKRRQLLLIDEGAGGRGRDWLRLIAHEMAHLCQFELAQGEGRAEQWVAEGMAEWVAFTVLERLGLDTVRHGRVAARMGIRNHASLVAARLDLETLGSPRGFMLRHRKEGSLPTYQLAFLMVDYLIERNGFTSMVEYFSAFGQGHGRRESFQKAFGQSLEAFEAEILPHLKTVH
jgi:hypothetical protein